MRRMANPNLPFNMKLKMSPVADALSLAPVKLPDVKAPEVEGVSVKVSKPGNVGEADLIERLHELERKLGTTRARKVGEAVAMGDDVKLDTLGYSDKKLIPFSARFGFWMELAPQVQLPGWAETLVGAKVGDSVQMIINLPKTYPVAELRGRQAQFIVDIRDANEVKPLSADDPTFLAKAGRGANVDDLMHSLREDIEVELARVMVVEGEQLVLDELVKRAKVTVPKDLVDQEIKRHWAQVEGKELVDRKFDVDEQNEAMNLWLADKGTRADAERRLQVSLVLKAIGDAKKLSLTPEKMESILAKQASAFGLTAQQVHQGLREEGELTQKMANVAYHLMMVEYVMQRAKVEFEGVKL
jgi:trigger factor